MSVLAQTGKRLTRAELARWLEMQGFRISELTLVSEGDYTAEDSDWNYKDIAHVNYVHQATRICSAFMNRKIEGAIQTQSIFGLWVPTVNFTYETEKFCQLYAFTMFFYIVVVETRSEAVGPVRARTTTTYSIGCPRWLAFTAPIIKWMFRRNYSLLMADDLAMRSRRGELRKLGYGFHMAGAPGDSYDFEDASNVAKNSLRLPPNAPRHSSCNYVEVLGDSNEAYFGDVGLLGYRLVRNGSKVILFPRACPHEGASLDRLDCNRGFIQCLWHGRRIQPIGSFNWSEDAVVETSTHRISTVGSQLTVEILDGTARAGTQ
jgi:hypothetical protein